jgi:hypothetical protein
MRIGEGRARTKRAPQLPKTTVIDPAELRALRARSTEPSIVEGTPPHGIQPTARPTRRVRATEIRALVVASGVARTAQKRMKVPAIRMCELVDGLRTEQMTPLQIARVHTSHDATIAAPEIAPAKPH